MGRTACTETQCLYKGTLYLLLYGGFNRKNVMFLPLTKGTVLKDTQQTNHRNIDARYFFVLK